ncbi:unnamed protein product [Fusarium fujikuroi]|nr:unnamed protein product [Fusarium fujikuroi]
MRSSISALVKQGQIRTSNEFSSACVKGCYGRKVGSSSSNIILSPLIPDARIPIWYLDDAAAYRQSEWLLMFNISCEAGPGEERIERLSRRARLYRKT